MMMMGLSGQRKTEIFLGAAVRQGLALAWEKQE